MPFERDDLRHEARQGLASTLVFWPKVDGIGNVLVSATAGQNRATFYDSRGNLISGPTNISGTTVSGVSRFDISVPAIADLQEGAYVVVTYTPDGTQHPGEAIERVHTIPFDVVLQPWGQSTVSLNDLQDRFPTIVGWLTRMAQVLDASSPPTAAVLASRFAHKAHAELYVWIRNKMRIEQSARGIAGYLRPRLIVDRLRLHPLEVELALSLIFEANVSTAAEGRDAAELADRFRKAATTRFAVIGDLEYDATEDRLPDTKLETLSRTVPARRVQGR